MRADMKYVIFAFVALFELVGSVPDASAVVCARGVNRAECLGPREVGARHPVRSCHLVRGARVCR